MNRTIYLSGGLLDGQRRDIPRCRTWIDIPFSAEGDWAEGVTVPYTIRLLGDSTQLGRFWFPLGWTLRQCRRWIKTATKEQLSNIQMVYIRHHS